jgi:diguanylate cyclase (GGDEF)-like protein/PAS domain S-box-containing protein
VTDSALPFPTRSSSSRSTTEWLLVLGGLLLLGVFLAFSLYAEHGSIDARESERLSAQTRIVHDNLTRQLDGVNRALASVRDDLPRWRAETEGMARASQRLRAFTDAMPGVRTMTILDADGRIIAASRPELLGGNFRDRPYFQAVLKAPDMDTLYVSEPFKTSLGIWAINVVRMVSGVQGAFAGIVSATLDPEEFGILLESVRYSEDMRVGLNHGDGAVFLTAPPREELYGTRLNRPGSFYTRHVESGRDSNVFVGTMLSTGGERMVALRTIRPAALKMDKAFMVAASRDRHAQFAAWRAKAWTEGGLFALLAAISCGGLVLLQQRRRLAESEAAAAEAALRAKSEEVDRFFAVSLDLLAIADFDGRFVKLNPAWQQTLGYPVAELEGTHFIDLVHPDDRDATLTATASLAVGDKVIGFTNRYRAANGEYRYIEWHSVPVPEAGLIYGAARDVTNQRLTQGMLQDLNVRLQAQTELLRTQAYIDGLTGVANRRRFDEALKSEWRRCRREKTPLALLMIDIDHFKHFNDHYGHQAGDDALIAVAASLRLGMGRSHDLVARYGGEEFVCLLPESDLEGAVAKAEALRTAIERLEIDHEVSPVAPNVTISVGVAAQIPSVDSDPAQLLAAADAALYAAKQGGRNRVCAATMPSDTPVAG